MKKDNPRNPDSRLTPAVRDLIAIALAALVVFGLAVQLDLFERYSAWQASHNAAFEIDELFVALFILPVAVGVFALRRWRELVREVAAHRQTADTLRLQSVRLHIAAEIGRMVTSLLDLDHMLPRVADLIREQLGYYLVVVSLVDETGEWLDVGAVSGEASSQLLAEGLRLRVGGQSIVGQVAATGQPRIAQDVSQDAAHRPHPGLPATRSEAALPLRHGALRIGVLDVESAQLNAFTPESVAVLTVVADQLAIAIYNARLYTTVKDHARELEQTYERIQEGHERLRVSEKMASLGRFMADVAHELNNPLGACRAALAQLDQLISEYEASIGEASVNVNDHQAIAHDMRQAARLAGQGADRVAGFVRSIKAQSRETSPADRVRFDAVPVIRESLLLVDHALRQSRCSVVFEPEAEVVELVGLPGSLAQVVTNLVTNAIDASAERGGGPITLRLRRQADSVELQVSDQGAGIPPEFQAKLFHTTFTTKPVGLGTGLGLGIIHDIVAREFGGTIDFVSQVGQGTTFTLRFPQLREN
jgi:signal transduction histidine kinase